MTDDAGIAALHVPAWRRVLGSWWLLAVVVLATYLLSPVRDATEHDPAFVPLTAHSLVHQRDVALDEFGAQRLLGHPIVVSDGSLDTGFVVGLVGADGWTQLQAAVADPDVDVLDYFPWTSAVVAVPGVLVTDLLAAVGGGPDSEELIAEHRFAFVHTASASVVVLGAVLALRAAALVVLSGSVDRRRVLANAVALVVAFGTSAWSTASRALWQQTPSILMLSLALWCAVRVDAEVEADDGGGASRSDPWVLGLGAAAAGSAIARPTNLAFAGILFVWVLVRRRPTVATLASVLTGALAVVGAFVVVNVVLVDRLVPAYYSAGRVQFGGWFAEAVAANWVSPSRGLLVASPVLLLAVPGAIVAWRDPERRSLVVALWTSVAAVTLSISAFPQWWAGHSFGPRFMTEAVPQLVVLALPAVDVVFAADRLRAGSPRRGRSVAAAVAVVALAAWSMAFHATGAVAGASGCWNRFPVDVDSDPGRIWSIADAQVLEPVRRVLDDERRAAQDAACLLAAPT